MLGSRSYSGLTQSIRMMRQIMGGRMYPLTLEGSTRRCGNWCGEGSTPGPFACYQILARRPLTLNPA
jgi:hypothetical protein